MSIDRWAAGLMLSGGALVAMAACGSSKAETPEPLPPGIEATPMHYLFTACNHGNRIYSSRVYSGEQAAIVKQDPTCKDGAR